MKCTACLVVKNKGTYFRKHSRVCNKCLSRKNMEARKGSARYLEYQKNYAIVNREKIKERKRKYYIDHAKEIKEKLRKWRRANPSLKRAQDIRYPEKYKARNVVKHAIRDGEIKRQPCEKCNSTVNVQGHHPDYSRPLFLVWLCHRCHLLVHHS